MTRRTSCACGGGCPVYVADSQTNATRRGTCEPAPTVKFGHAMNEVVWVVDRRTNSKDGKGGMVPTVPVPITEPAPTFTGKAGGQWVVRPPDEWEQVSGQTVAGGDLARRPLSEPSLTVTSCVGIFRFEPCDDGEQGAQPCDDESERGAPAWTRERHATTVVGSFSPDIIAAPGYRTSVSRQDAPESVKVTTSEAAVLQSFRPDYPWQGSRTKQFEQIGNAVPPRLALHVIASLIGVAVPEQEAAA